jgi:hypothetical protein
LRLCLIYPQRLFNVLPDRTSGSACNRSARLARVSRLTFCCEATPLEQPDYARKMAAEREFLVLVNDRAADPECRAGTSRCRNMIDQAPRA